MGSSRDARTVAASTKGVIMKLDLEKFNWYGFNHDAVQEMFEGDLTYVGTFCVKDNYLPVAVYHNAKPNRNKKHKDYLLLWLEYEAGRGVQRALVAGLDERDMLKEKLQSGIFCYRCKDLIYSVNRHDFRYCKCEACAIDGGKDYTKISGNIEDYQLVTIDLLRGETLEKMD